MLHYKIFYIKIRYRTKDTDTLFLCLNIYIYINYIVTSFILIGKMYISYMSRYQLSISYHMYMRNLFYHICIGTFI